MTVRSTNSNAPPLLQVHNSAYAFNHAYLSISYSYQLHSIQLYSALACSQLNYDAADHRLCFILSRLGVSKLQHFQIVSLLRKFDVITFFIDFLLGLSLSFFQATAKQARYAFLITPVFQCLNENQHYFTKKTYYSLCVSVTKINKQLSNMSYYFSKSYISFNKAIIEYP